MHDPDITPAPTRMPTLDVRTPRPTYHVVDMPQWAVDAEYTPPPPTWWERTWLKIRIIAAVLPHTPKLIYGVTMRNLRTTLSAVIGGLAGILSAFGIVVPHEWFEPIIGITVIIVGLFARDSGNGSDAQR